MLYFYTPNFKLVMYITFVFGENLSLRENQFWELLLEVS